MINGSFVSFIIPIYRRCAARRVYGSRCAVLVRRLEEYCDAKDLPTINGHSQNARRRWRSPSRLLYTGVRWKMRRKRPTRV